MRPHRNLDVWKKSVEFASRIYVLTSKFPKNEEYGLVAQLKRAAISIPSNIAEGAARRTKKELVQFLYMANGSASEIDTQLEIACNLGYIDEPGLFGLRRELDGISKMLSAMIRSLKNKK